MVTFLKELALDLSITLLFGVVVHYSLMAYGTDEVQAIEATLGWVVDHMPSTPERPKYL